MGHTNYKESTEERGKHVTHDRREGNGVLHIITKAYYLYKFK